MKRRIVCLRGRSDEMFSSLGTREIISGAKRLLFALFLLAFPILSVVIVPT
jgi:hypothetical protein